MDFDIIVVASHHRKPLIIDYLKDIPHKVVYTPDYELPVGFVPSIGGLVQNHLGAYRCFRGHQDAISKCKKDMVLIFEDDAVPNNEKWLSIIIDGVFLLNEFEMVSFHSRQYNIEQFLLVCDKYIKPRTKDVWIVAALCYVLKKKSFDFILNAKYMGIPYDLLLYRNFSYCLLEPSIFDHNCSEGSLIDI